MESGEGKREKFVLPPISSFLQNGLADQLMQIPIVEVTEHQETDEGLENSGPYRLEDDLSIFKAIHSFYGESFCGTVPWSFWQTYRKVTGSNRSTSSLYHHWNGSIQRKYGGYLRQKRLLDCIHWIEQEIETSKSPPKKHTVAHDTVVPVGLPLMHNKSLPPGTILPPALPKSSPGLSQGNNIMRPQSYIVKY